jgi:tRNA(Arg) A34 adenosine deaminase TadA
MESFQTKVLAQVEKLQTCSLREIEKSVTAKRTDWWSAQTPRKSGHQISPREAFESLFFDYMGLTKADLPIISESDSEIVWESRNPCPTLQACLQLGLDTRTVCKKAYEKSTQAFISRLDPQLRFVRSYSEIRPYAEFCRESIIRMDFKSAMLAAIEEARLSRAEGNKGYGAVLLYGQRVLAKCHDTAGTAKDPVMHAEVNAIRQAVQMLGEVDLSGAVLVSTCEPCPMCSSLAVWANVSTIVYGASIEETAKMGKARIGVSAKEIVEKSPVQIEIIPGVLRDECLALYR